VNQNPYAPPGATASAAASPAGQPQPWTTGEALRLAWARFNEFGSVLVPAYIVSGFFAAAVGQAGNVPKLAGAVLSPIAAGSLPIAGVLIGQVAAAFFDVGATRMVLEAVRGRAPTFATLFGGGDRFLPLLGLNLLMFSAIALGFVLLVVPGIILALGLSLSKFYLIDAGMGPVEAMKASWSATRGQKGEVMALSAAGFGLTLLGLLMCCVGTLVTIPLYYIAFAIAFVRMSGLGTTAPQTTAPPPQPPPYLPFP